MPYRDDRHALETRRDELLQELSSLSTRAEALRDVLRGHDAVALELADTEARIADLDARHTRLLDGRSRRRVRLSVCAAAGAIGALAVMGSATVARHTTKSAHSTEQVAVSGLALDPDTYVAQPLHHAPVRGPVLNYREDGTSDRPGADWTLYSDGTIVREGRAEAAALLGQRAKDAAYELVRIANELRPEAMGAVPAGADSAIPRSYEVYAAGGRRATNADRARIFELASRVRFADEGSSP